MQPQIAVTLALAEGKSTVTESIFENRFLYVEELKKMGADITVEDRVATILDRKNYREQPFMPWIYVPAPLWFWQALPQRESLCWKI